MIAAILFTISMAALGQFAVYYWRAVVTSVAAQPLSDRVKAAAGLTTESVGATDFDAVMTLHDLTPGLKDHVGGLSLVRAYYRVIDALGRLVGAKVPSVAAWAQREMATCSRYVAVLLDQRLEGVLACAAEARSV